MTSERDEIVLQTVSPNTTRKRVSRRVIESDSDVSDDDTTIYGHTSSEEELESEHDDGEILVRSDVVEYGKPSSHGERVKRRSHRVQPQDSHRTVGSPKRQGLPQVKKKLSSGRRENRSKSSSSSSSPPPPPPPSSSRRTKFGEFVSSRPRRNQAKSVVQRKQSRSDHLNRYESDEAPLESFRANRTRGHQENPWHRDMGIDSHMNGQKERLISLRHRDQSVHEQSAYLMLTRAISTASSFSDIDPFNFDRSAFLGLTEQEAALIPVNESSGSTVNNFARQSPPMGGFPSNGVGREQGFANPYQQSSGPSPFQQTSNPYQQSSNPYQQAPSSFQQAPNAFGGHQMRQPGQQSHANYQGSHGMAMGGMTLPSGPGGRPNNRGGISIGPGNQMDAGGMGSFGGMAFGR